MVTNKVNLRIVDKVIFNEIFTFNMGVKATLTENDTRLTIEPIEPLTDEYAKEGAMAVTKLIFNKLLAKNIFGTCNGDNSLKITVRHRKFILVSLNDSFSLSVADTNVIAVMTEIKD